MYRVNVPRVNVPDPFLRLNSYRGKANWFTGLYRHNIKRPLLSSEGSQLSCETGFPRQTPVAGMDPGTPVMHPIGLVWADIHQACSSPFHLKKPPVASRVRASVTALMPAALSWGVISALGPPMSVWT